MWRWGADWLWADSDGGSPLALIDRDTGAVVDPIVVDEHTGAPLDVRRLRVVTGGDQLDPVATSRSGSVDQPDHEPT